MREGRRARPTAPANLFASAECATGQANLITEMGSCPVCRNGSVPCCDRCPPAQRPSTLPHHGSAWRAQNKLCPTNQPPALVSHLGGRWCAVRLPAAYVAIAFANAAVAAAAAARCGMAPRGGRWRGFCHNCHNKQDSLLGSFAMAATATRQMHRYFVAIIVAGIDSCEQVPASCRFGTSACCGQTLELRG